MRRRWALFAILLGTAFPAMAAQRVSVAQLEGILAHAQALPDGDLAARLSDLQLTERFNSERLARWRAGLPGARSQRALMGLADRSAFLDPPQAEVPANAAPDFPEQRRIMGLAAAYVGDAVPQLPRFYATRTTTHFEGAPGSTAEALPLDAGPLHATRISRATVMYRDGQETAEAGPVKVENPRLADQGLRTWGVFGPILGLVLLDAAENKLTWERWEQNTGGTLAVFHYSVPKEKSHYEVRYCCVASSYGLESNSFQEMSAYHGEIAVDPANGIILRLTIEADLDANDPISRAALAVEYGTVELGGMTYICPARSVSIAVAKTLRQVQDAVGREWPSMGPRQMLVNHVDYEQYHLFRAESHVLSGDEERASGVTPDATLPSAAPAEMSPSEEELVDAPPAKPVEASDRNGAMNAGPASTASPDGEPAEISTTEATGLPESPARQAEQPVGTHPNGFTLRINARLVDVNVVALDKKGRPITNLKPEDFEVYDNGVKQDVRSFNQAEAGSASQSPAPETQPTPVPVHLEFSNHPANTAKSASFEGNAIVVLMDPSNLAFTDFSDARQQLKRFLGTVPSNQRIALYAMRYHGFQVLQEATMDHAALAAQLAKWMPTAQDLANAGSEEQRNRQQIETVHSPEDMLSVNGNFSSDTTTQTEALDPKLRELGSNPGPNALSILVDVAHHLAPLPGHKSLIWVTSDNSLADWNKLSISIEKGSKFIQPIALRTQEAMNNAHVSVYPLDASHLEANVINADIGRRNVELTPTYQRPIEQEQAQEGPEVQEGSDFNPYSQNRAFSSGGRLQAQLEQDMHPIQGVFREVAEATGGRALRRTNNMIGELNGVVADGQATYLLGFSPAQPADGQYHLLTVKVIGRRDVTLRYRTGYKYDKEPTTLKERFAQTVWQPADASEIGLSAKPITDAAGTALRVTVSGADLSLAQQSASWTGKLDIFLVQRDEEGQHAKVSGHTVGLRLKPATYQKALKDGLTFDERIESKPSSGSLRVLVVDLDSGRMGSVTVSSLALASNQAN